MKRMAGFVVCAAWVVLACASAQAQDAPGVNVSDPRWVYLQDGYFSRNTHFSAGGSSGGYAASNPPLYEVSTLLRNVGEKSIKSVTWEYVFYGKGQPSEVVYSHRFKSGKRIEPGQSVRLKEYLPAASGNGPKRFTDSYAVRISRLKYTDGTVWEAAKVRR